MKNKIRQAYFLLIAGILANISLFTAATSPQTGWQYDKPGAHSCFEIAESQPIIMPPESASPTYSNERPMANEELEIIQSIKKPDNITEEIIDPTLDQIIRCPQGSILHLDANTLVDQQGEIVTEPVMIRVKECYKLKDVIANKLTTTSNGALIETAGMVEITALAGNDTLSLAANKDVDIAMPGGAGDGYDLFNASIDEFGNMNWILDEDNPVRKKYIAAQKLTNTKKGERGIPRQTELAELFKNDTACNFGITHYILEEPAGNFEMREFNFKDEEGNKLSDFLKTAFTSDKKTVSNACANNQRYSVSMAVDHRGKLLHPILDEQLSSDTRKKLRDMLKEAPILNRNLFDPLSNGRERLKLLFGNLDKRHVKPEVLKTSDDSNTPWMSIRNNVVVNSTQEQKLSYYVMSSMRLGWINCDRFTNYPRATLVSLNLEIENPQVDEVMLVFETSQSAIAAYKKEDGTFISQPIPQNTNIKVVCMINDAKNPKIFTYGILSGRNKKFLIRENQNKGERDPGAEINTPA